MSDFPILCIRSLDISQASPFLEMAWATIKSKHSDSRLLLKDQPHSSSPMRPDATIDDTQSERQPASVSHVISWSIPNERTIEDITLSEGVSAVPGPINAVYKLSDKRATKMLFEQFNLPTPRWELLDREFTHGELLKPGCRDKLEQELVSHIAFPVILKPLWDCMGHGIEIISNKDQLIKTLSQNQRKNILIESFIDGALGCIEIAGTPGNYFFQPPCYTGQSSMGVRSDFDTIRVCHPGLFSKQLTGEVQTKLILLLNHLGFNGVCCVDFIVTENSLYLLGINPRISGISCLSSAASGVNSFESTYLISSGQWQAPLPYQSRQGAALQLGGKYADEISSVIRDEGNNVTVYRDNIITVDGKDSRNMIAGGTISSIENVLQSVQHSSLSFIALTLHMA